MPVDTVEVEVIKHWAPLRLACESTNHKLVETALDTIQKLIAYGYFVGGVVDPQHPDRDVMNEIIDAVCNCFSHPDDNVHLQIVKGLLTAITSTLCEIHEATLLKVVRTCYNIYLVSDNLVIRTTAKATLKQMLNIVFQRMEAQAVAEERQGLVLDSDMVKKEDVGSSSATDAASPSPDSSVNFSASTEAEAEPEPAADGGAEPEPQPEPEPEPEPQPETKTDEKEDEEEKEEREPTPTPTGEGGGEQAMAETQAQPEAKPAEQPPVPAEEKKKDSTKSRADILQRDALLVFRALCKLSIKALPEGASETSTDLRSKLLSLELLIGLLEQAGGTFKTSPRFLAAVKQYLCISILQNGTSSVVAVFSHSLRLFLLALESFKAHLKTEIGVFFNSLILRVLESTNTTTQQKWLVLQVLHTICKTPQVLVDVFLNYDCDIEANDIYERMVRDLSREAQGHMHHANTDAETIERNYANQVQGLECLVDIVRSLVSWAEAGLAEQRQKQEQLKNSGDGDGDGDGNASDGEEEAEAEAEAEGEEGGVKENGDGDAEKKPKGPDKGKGKGKADVDVDVDAGGDPSEFRVSVEDFAQKKQVKSEWERGIEKFNMKPKNGVRYLLEKGLIKENTPQEIARFLHSAPGLDKKTVGEYLGEGDSFNIAVMYEYVDQQSFAGSRFDQALRSFCSGFRLPGESQKIDRMLEKFAERFLSDNPGVFNSADTAYVLAYSVIMLNTDLHNPDVKNKMTLEEFIRNNRGINENEDLPAEYLTAIYNEIRDNEIVMEDEVTAKATINLTEQEKANPRIRRMLYQLESEQVIKASVALLKSVSKRRTTYYTGRNAAYVRSMFEVTWAPALAALSILVEEDNGDHRVVQLCLGGFSVAIRLSAMFLMETERNAFVTSLAKFTFLNNLREMEEKNIESIKTLMQVALRDGNYLQGSWIQVLKCVSMLEHLHLVGTGAGVQTFGKPDSMGLSGTGSGGDNDIRRLTSRSSAGSINVPITPPAVGGGGGFGPGSGGVGAGGLARRQSQIGHKGHRAEMAIVGSPDRVSVDSAGSGSGSGSGMVVGIGGTGPLTTTRDSETFRRMSAQVSRRRLDASAIEGFNAANVAEKIDQVAVDRVFHDSYRLNNDAIVDFTRALCSVSLDEIHHPYNPRSFSLQKIIEVTHYNMDRVRLVWSRMWHVLSDFFQTVCTNPNLSISLYATDSLRQLAMKFLEKEELEGFQFQKDFLRPFEEIYVRNPRSEIRELVVSCVQQMVLARAHHIRSGWRSIFVLLTHTSASSEPAIVELAFSVVEKAMEDHFDLISEVAGDIGDLTHCLAAFAMNRYFPRISLRALDRLYSLAALVAAGRGVAVSTEEDSTSMPDPASSASMSLTATATATAAAAAAATPRNRSKAAASSGIDGEGGGGSDAAAGGEPQSGAVMYTDSELHLRAWFPVLTGFSRCVAHPALEVRSRALKLLFEVLSTYGPQFSASLWELVYKGVIFPIFDDVRHSLGLASPGPGHAGGMGSGGRRLDVGQPFDGEHRMLERELVNTEWLQTTCRPALQHLVALFSQFFESVSFLLPDLIDLLVNTVYQEVESLAKIGVASIFELVVVCAPKLTPEQWRIVVASINDMFKTTTPIDLMNVNMAADVPEEVEVVEEEVKGQKEVTSTSTSISISREIVEHVVEDAVSRGAEDEPEDERIARELVQSVLESVVAEVVGEAGAEEAQPEPEPAVTPPPVPPRSPQTHAQRVGLDFPSVRRQCVIQLSLIQMVNDIVGKVYDYIGTDNLFGVLACLESSYSFAHEFNRNMSVRMALWRAGFMPSMPNLLKQETHGVAAVLSLLLRLSHTADLETNPNPTADDRRRSEVGETRLIALVTTVIDDYNDRAVGMDDNGNGDHAASTAEEQRDALVWTPIVIQALRGLLTFSDPQFALHTRSLYPSLVKTIRSNSLEVRNALVTLFMRYLDGVDGDGGGKRA